MRPSNRSPPRAGDTRRRPPRPLAAPIVAVALVLAACEPRDATAPWLTMPDLRAHSARYFPVNAGDVHGPAAGHPLDTCDRCHADRSTGATPPPPAASFATYTCTGCHVEIRSGVFHDDVATLGSLARHAGLDPFDPARREAYDRACRSCHPTGVAVDHALVFPLPHGDAARTTVAACADCHRSTDRTVLGCAACHPHDQPATATAHAQVPDFVAGTTPAASLGCVRCHGDGAVAARVATHAFPIGGRSTAHAGPAGGACLSCHPALRAAPKAFAADFSRAACTGCHVSTTAGFHDDGAALGAAHGARGVTGFQFTTQACLDCHPDGAGGAPPYHGDLFPIGAGSAHAGISCGDCHGAVRADVAALRCAGCHADPARSPGFPTTHPAVNGIAILVALTPPVTSCAPAAYTPTSAECLACHARSAPRSPIDLVTGHPQGDTSFGKGPHRAAGCTTCHVVTTRIGATVAPPATPPAGYAALDFRAFVTPAGQPTTPSRSARGCTTCHATGCGNN